MCTTCGCAVTPGDVEIFTPTDADHQEHSHHHQIQGHGHTHDHHHHPGHSHHPDHNHALDHTHTIAIHEAILSKNDRLAERNRGFFLAKGLLVLNVLSSPGAGKTAFIERTLRELSSKIPGAVIVGDLATDNDARRLQASGASVVQITTGSICHLEAEMIAQALSQLNLNDLKLLVIENVGNLVCPAAYDLGESLRVALLSTTEGEDKPLKYPTLFKTADVVIINKIDIAEAVEFNRELALENISRVVPQATILEVSARTGAGMETWYHYLETQITQPLQLPFHR